MTDISLAIATHLGDRENFALQGLRSYLLTLGYTSEQINRAFKYWELSYFDYRQRGQVRLTERGRKRVAELLSSQSRPLVADAAFAPGLAAVAKEVIG